MELGDPLATTRDQRSRLHEALDTFDSAVTGLIGTIENGGLDHLEAAEKIALWQKVETFRNKLPLIDHRLIADAEASHLSEEYCSSTMTHFLIRVLQLSPGDAAARSVPQPRSDRVPPCWARSWNLCCPNWRRCSATVW